MMINRLIALGCLLPFLGGCAYLPVQPPSTYLQDLYRRIPYKVDGDYRVVNIFYATNRKIEDKKDEALSFLSEPDHKIKYATLDIKVRPRIKIGKMLPYRLRRAGLIEVQDTRMMERDVFVKQLTDAVKNSPHKSLLVVVFGYKTDFEAAAIDAAYFAYLLDVNTPVLVFDWPGDQPTTVYGYQKARSFAIDSGRDLGELLAVIIREVKPEKIWLKASSLGCQVVCGAFDYMHQQKDLADVEPEIDHVVLAAPDVDEDEFDVRFKDELTALSKKLTAYVSSNDEALLISGFINQDKRLGRQAVKAQEQEQFEEAKDLLYLKSLEPGKITIIDVTPINKTSYGHGYFLEAPEFYDDIYMRIFDKQPNINRRLYLLKFKDNIEYWVLRGE